MTTNVSAAAVRLKRAVPQFTVPDVLRTAQYYRDSLASRLPVIGTESRPALPLPPRHTSQSFGATTWSCSSGEGIPRSRY